MTNKLTLEQHVKWGDEFKELQERLVTLGVEIAIEYGKTKVRGVTDRVNKASFLIADAKYDLENLMFDDIPYEQEDRLLFSNIYAGRVGEYQKILEERKNKI